ncbi:MAG: hypothetical protein AAGJ46_17960 [Planctomycetota bacterium]
MNPYESQQGPRKCAATGRPLAAGEAYYSVVRQGERGPQRTDYAEAAWQGPPDDAVAWWRSRLPAAAASAPADRDEMMLRLFDQWAEEPDRVESRYILSLLMIRRRLLRHAEGSADGGASGDAGVLRLYRPKTDEHFEVPVAPPSPERSAAIQEELKQLFVDQAA